VSVRERTGSVGMPTTYAYAVRDRAGKTVSGTLEADSQASVASKLKGMGYAPISISETNTGMKREIKIPGFGGDKVKLKDLAIMSRQFATMISSGLSLLRSLTILSEQTENKMLAKSLGDVRNEIETGSSLSVAMGKHSPQVFPPLMVNMTKAGEVGGFLDAVLLQVGANYEAEVRLRGKVKSAMTYPIVVFIMAILAVIGMLLFIVPVFAGLFKSLGGTLPLPTRILVLMSNVLKLWSPVLLVVGIAGVIIWRKMKNKPGVRDVVDPLKLKLTRIRPTVHQDCPESVRTQPRHNDELRRADSAEPRHRVRNNGERGPHSGAAGCPGQCPLRRVLDETPGTTRRVPSHGGSDDGGRRGHRRPGHHARQDK